VGLVASVFRFHISNTLKTVFLAIGIIAVLFVAYDGLSDLAKSYNLWLRYWYGYFYLCPVIVAVYLIVRNLKDREIVT
jgi:hypothetical protein